MAVTTAHSGAQTLLLITLVGLCSFTGTRQLTRVFGQLQDTVQQTGAAGTGATAVAYGQGAADIPRGGGTTASLEVVCSCTGCWTGCNAQKCMWIPCNNAQPGDPSQTLAGLTSYSRRPPPRSRSQIIRCNMKPLVVLALTGAPARMCSFVVRFHHVDQHHDLLSQTLPKHELQLPALSAAAARLTAGG